MQPFDPKVMVNLFPGTSYDTHPHKPDLLSRLFPSATFYARVFLRCTRWLASYYKKHGPLPQAWAYGSSWGLQEMERTGLRLHVDGLEHIDGVKGPCVIVSNHMSTLETYLLPAMLRPRRQLTFVVKRSLVSMPGFGIIMRAANPVVVNRTSPREDLATIMEEGCKRLANGVSVVVFPQATRRRWFVDAQFNTIGAKLAKKAGVPLVPLAVKTDAWGIGDLVKELGPINVKSEALMRFFPPLYIRGSGHAEHKACREVIHRTFDWWQTRQNAIDQGQPALPYTDPGFVLPEIFGRKAEGQA